MTYKRTTKRSSSTYDDDKMITTTSVLTYLIYFFEQISKGESLNIDCNMNRYRCTIKQMLLERSDSMTTKCLLCSRDANTENCIQCDFCNRFLHFKCIKIEKSDVIYIKNNMCALCRQYKINT